MPPQLDDYLPANHLRYIGAAKTFAARSQFYAAFPQFVMIATLFYYQSNLIQSVFPSIWHWVAFLAIFGLATMAFEYVVVYPSQVVFNRGQGERENRSPMFQQVRENNAKLDRLLALSDGGDRADIECPDCGRILIRRFD